MRVLGDELSSMSQAQLYLSAAEARKLVGELQRLLEDPEANEHFHVFSEDGGAELSCSIVTEAKLSASRYTPAERKAFAGWKPKA